jgi:LmbE family N-acetylglucosaminyl deacetylase
MNTDKHGKNIHSFGGGLHRPPSLVLCFLCLLCFSSFPAVRAPAVAQDGSRGAGVAEAVEAIDRARNTARVLYVIAHPDDEGGGVGLLAYLSRHVGADVALLSITRGEGGQNAIGPEHGPKLGILRTAELEAACHHYGVRLFFTRAPDFGYSKTVEETLRIWGDAALDDMVAVVRSFRPHVVINNWAGTRGGHGHHQASGILTPQAVKAAGDPGVLSNFEPWRVEHLLDVQRGNSATGLAIPSDLVSPIWGKTYNEIGLEGFIQHRTQSIAGFRGSPFFRTRRTLVPAEGYAPVELDAFVRPLTTLPQRIPRAAPYAADFDLAERELARARESALRLDWAAAAEALTAARSALSRPLSGRGLTGADTLSLLPVVQAREKVERAVALAIGLRIEAQADRAELVAGESFTVQVSWHLRQEVPAKVAGASLVLPDGWQVSGKEQQRDGSVRFTVAAPTDAAAPSAPNSWMHPWPEPPVSARLSVEVAGDSIEIVEPAAHQRVTSTRAEMVPLELVPAVTVSLEPKLFVVRQQQPPAKLELVARVHHNGTREAELTAELAAPPGWTAPAPAKLRFTGAGDELVRFVVRPPARPSAGTYEFAARARLGGKTFSTALEPLPSLPTRLWREPAAAAVRVFDVALPEGLRIGYVAAANDPLPAALAQLGIRVELLDELALAFGDLSRYDAVAIGIRAYELRDDLARSNRRLLDYVAAGGTLLVQYQRENVWNALRPAPFPAEVGGGIGSDRARVADEAAPVRLLVPGHSVLAFPNRIGPADFDGWVQERGLYFWSKWDERYTPLVAMADPGEAETRGALLVARHGSGTYIYTGLALFRQLPAGVPGAWRLFVNLLSQSRASR